MACGNSLVVNSDDSDAIVTNGMLIITRYDSLCAVCRNRCDYIDLDLDSRHARFANLQGAEHGVANSHSTDIIQGEAVSELLCETNSKLE